MKNLKQDIYERKYDDIFSQLKLNYINDLLDKNEETANSFASCYTASESNICYQELFRIVHSIKGTAAMYEINMISAICHSFEDILQQNTTSSTKNNNVIIEHILKYLDLIQMSALIEKDNLLLAKR